MTKKEVKQVVISTTDTVPVNGSTNPVSSDAAFDGFATKQGVLVSGTNIKTINGSSIVGSGDLTVTASGASEIKLYTVANLRLETAPSTAVRYYTTNFGMEGMWWYDPSDTTTADNTGLVLVSTNGKRFKRIYDGINVRVQWFGVLGNGTNETTAFKLAIDNTVGKTLLIENITIKIGGLLGTAGSYYSLQVSGDRRKILGNNGIIKHITSGGQPDIFWIFSSCDYLTVDGLEFDMESLAGDPVSGTTVLYFDSCTHLNVTNNYIHDNGHAAIKVVGGNYQFIDHNKIATTDSGIFCLADSTSGASDLIITNNIVSGGTSEGIGVFSHGNEANISKRWLVANNVVKDKVTSGAFNICRSKYGLLSNNIVSNCGAMCFLIDSGSGFAYNEFSTDIDIIGNHCSDLEFGIKNLSDRCSAIDNTFVNVKRTAILTNLHVDVNGINHNVNVTGLVIKNNQFHNCAYLDQAFPIIELQDLRNSSIVNNTFTASVNDSVKCFRMYDLDNVVIQGNHAWDSKIEWVNADTTSFGNHLIIKDNVFSNSNFSFTYPLSGGAFKWIFEGNRWTVYETDPTSTTYDLVPSGGNLDVNYQYIRNEYYIPTGQTIATIRPSWYGREITLISRGSLIIVHGSNLSLAFGSNASLPSNQTITLRCEGTVWREKYRSLT